MTSPDDILTFLKRRVSSATHPDDVAALMTPLASDSAWVHLGGSGARQQIFLLPKDSRAVFQFDGNDRLVGYGVYQSNGPWDGNNVLPVSGSDVSLILV
jgi:hypothetical protein